MSEEPAAIKATYHHWRPVKGGGVLRLEFDVKLEQQEQVLKYLGPPGLPGETKWVAIALLVNQPAEVVPIARARKRPETEGEIAVAEGWQYADRLDFQLWASAELDPDLEPTIETAAEFIRLRCGVESRREFKTNPEALAKWKALKAEFEASL